MAWVRTSGLRVDLGGCAGVGLIPSASDGGAPDASDAGGSSAGGRASTTTDLGLALSCTQDLHLSDELVFSDGAFSLLSGDLERERERVRERRRR